MYDVWVENERSGFSSEKRKHRASQIVAAFVRSGPFFCALWENRVREAWRANVIPCKNWKISRRKLFSFLREEFTYTSFLSCNHMANRCSTSCHIPLVSTKTSETDFTWNYMTWHRENLEIEPSFWESNNFYWIMICCICYRPKLISDQTSYACQDIIVQSRTM